MYSRRDQFSGCNPQIPSRSLKSQQELNAKVQNPANRGLKLNPFINENASSITTALESRDVQPGEGALAGAARAGVCTAESSPCCACRNLPR